MIMLYIEKGPSLEHWYERLLEGVYLWNNGGIRFLYADTELSDGIHIITQENQRFRIAVSAGKIVHFDHLTEEQYKKLLS